MMIAAMVTSLLSSEKIHCVARYHEKKKNALRKD